MPDLVTSKDYWDDVSEHYDTLYTSKWSQKEDARVANWMKQLRMPPESVVLDIGCGTGLGLRLLSSGNSTFHYTGLDISPKMISKFNPGNSSNALSMNLIVGDLAEFEWEHARHPNLIMAIYGSLSFCRQRWKAIGQLAQIQSRADKIFLMFLATRSLRSILRFDFQDHGVIQTRGSKSDKVVPVYYDRPHDVKRYLESMGYEILLLAGDGPLSGVLELPFLWRLNSWIGDHTTLLSHIAIVIGEKK